MTNVLMIGSSSAYSRGLETRLAVEDGVRLLRARSAIEGFETFIKEGVDSVVVDLGVRDRDGVGVIETLRAARPNSTMPIAALMATDDPLCEQRVREAGASEVIVKTADVDEVVEQLAGAVRGQRGAETPDEGAASANSMTMMRVRAELDAAVSKAVKAVFERELGVVLQQEEEGVDVAQALSTDAAGTELVCVDLGFTGAVAGVVSLRLTSKDALQMQRQTQPQGEFSPARWLDVVRMVGRELGGSLGVVGVQIDLAAPVLMVARGMRRHVQSVEQPALFGFGTGDARVQVECLFIAGRMNSGVEALAAG